MGSHWSLAKIAVTKAATILIFIEIRFYQWEISSGTFCISNLNCSALKRIKILVILMWKKCVSESRQFVKSDNADIFRIFECWYHLWFIKIKFFILCCEDNKLSFNPSPILNFGWLKRHLLGGSSFKPQVYVKRCLPTKNRLTFFSKCF